MADHKLLMPVQRPEDWRDWAIDKPAASAPLQFDRAKMQRWAGTSPVMDQPALDHHLIVFHEGGPKHVVRAGGGAPTKSVDVALHATSTVSSGSVYRWHTEGPIAFTHIFVQPSRFAELVARTFNRDPASVGFAETVGREDPFVTQLIQLMICASEDPDWELVSDYYLDALLVRLVSISGSGEFPRPPRIALTPRTVARVREFMRANLHMRVRLDDLADVAGYSRFHFVRAFKLTTGLPPYAYLLSERIAAAKDLLRTTDTPIADVAAQTGFATHAQFSSRFRETVGETPADYRRRTGGRRRHADND